MAEKIKLFMSLRNLRYCKMRDDLDVCQRLVNIYYYGRYSLPDYYNLDKKLVRMREILYNASVSREERVENFKREFNEHVQLVFTGKTEEGQKLFNELENFFKLPELDIWR